MNNFNTESLIISLFYHEKASILDYKFIKDMFQEQNNYEYLENLKKGILNNLTIQQINQNFISKKQLNIYPIEFCEEQLKLYTINTLMEIFYKHSIDLIWNKKKLEKTDIGILEELNILIDNIQSMILELNKKEKKNPFSSFREKILLTKERIDSGDFDEGIVGLSSSISELDRITGGFKDAEYILIAGRPSMGKTSLALDIVADNIKENKHILVCSVEMSSEQLIERLIPKINNNLTLKNTVLGENLNNRINEILAASLFLEKSNLVIEDFEDLNKVTILDIQRAAEEFKKDKGVYPDLIVIDYIQIIKDYLNRKDENQIITDISGALQRLAKKTKAPVIALSQLNRTLEERVDKRPKNSDLRSSGALEQDADIIIFPYRDSVYLEASLREKIKKNPNSQELAEALNNLLNSNVEIGELIVSKNRNGAKGTAFCEFYKPAASYVESASIFTYNEDLEEELSNF